MGDGLCKLCGTGTETIIHALRDCPKVKEVLEMARVPTSVVNATHNSIKEWIMAATDQLLMEGLSKSVALLWNIWNHRNKLVHEEEMQDAREVVNLTTLLQEEYDRANETKKNPLIIIKQAPRWRKPIGDTIKLTIDVAFNIHIWVATFGIVARDMDSFVLTRKASMMEGRHTLEIVEAYAFQEGVMMALDKGWQHVVLEGDVINIVHRLANPDLKLSTPAAILKATSQRLQSDPGIKIHYVWREANRVAHGLAKWVMENNAHIRFQLDHPEFILSSVMNDAIND
ncbi:hypothetical protein V6N13_015099 [Hibiscus sabdariffa]|uniref:Uncharacterized protein n=2 Tax=Hibiscus sabdariffa TaxID=183260 RepID=A0ABR2AZX9_9ROSI